MKQKDLVTVKLPRTIWILGFVSMFMDISSEIIHSLLPAFLVDVIGVSALTIGLLEGLAQATVHIVKVFSGVLSDTIRHRKYLAVAGYALGAFSKPLFAIASSVFMVFTARVIDRVGKGVRGAPRDALIADVTTANIRGSAYGLRQALDTLGALLGPLLAIGLMFVFAEDFRKVFWIAFVPGLLAVCLLVVVVKEPKHSKTDKRTAGLSLNTIRLFPKSFWSLCLFGIVLMFARFSEAFLVLRLQGMGLALTWLPSVMVVMNLAYALSAYPFGKIADKFGSRHFLGLGMLTLFVAQLMIGISHNLILVFIGILLWGVHMAMTQGLLSMRISNTVPPEIRGSAFGTFGLCTGFAALFSSLLAGFIWSEYSAEATFLTGAMFSLLSLIFFYFKIM